MAGTSVVCSPSAAIPPMADFASSRTIAVEFVSKRKRNAPRDSIHQRDE